MVITSGESQGEKLSFRTKGEDPYFAEEREGWKGYIEWEVRSAFESMIEVIHG